MNNQPFGPIYSDKEEQYIREQSEKAQERINKQIQHEGYFWLLFLAIAIFLSCLTGCGGSVQDEPNNQEKLYCFGDPSFSGPCAAEWMFPEQKH